MSLVNNMLRDLDQRRKESEGTGGAIKLMPASDFVGEDKKGLVQIVLIALALITAALTYFWYVSTNSDAEQQLGIQVGAVPASNLPVDPDQLIQDLEASILLSEEALAASEPLVAVTSVEPDAIVPQREDPVEELPRAVAQDEPPAEPVQPSGVTGSSPAAPLQLASATPSPDLIRSAPVESVKEAPRFTNEQLDTIAVQEALRQISNGQTEAAYDTLTEFILSNRYAHQSRETYAKLLMSAGRVNDAAALIDGGLELAPNHAGFKKVKARLLMAAGDIGAAVRILISRAPDVDADAEYHDLLATAQLSSRDYAGAVISYRGLVQHDQSQGKWWYGFAAAHDQLGNAAEARQAYSRAIQYSNLSANLRRRSQERLGVLNVQ